MKPTTETRHRFYATFFDDKEGYKEKEVNGFWLIRYWDSGRKRWLISLYSKESYENYTANKQNPLIVDFTN